MGPCARHVTGESRLFYTAAIVITNLASTIPVTRQDSRALELDPSNAGRTVMPRQVIEIYVGKETSSMPLDLIARYFLGCSPIMPLTYLIRCIFRPRACDPGRSVLGHGEAPVSSRIMGAAGREFLVEEVWFMSQSDYLANNPASQRLFVFTPRNLMPRSKGTFIEAMLQCHI